MQESLLRVSFLTFVRSYDKVEAQSALVCLCYSTHVKNATTPVEGNGFREVYQPFPLLTHHSQDCLLCAYRSLCPFHPLQIKSS